MEPEVAVRGVMDVPVRPAATLAVLREGPSGPEVLLTVRPAGMRFMGGAIVFPGGAVSSSDSDDGWGSAATDLAHELPRSEADPPARALAVCVIREAFEEVGFILGHNVERLDRRVTNDLLAACLERKVTLGLDRLVPAGRWVTPLGAPVRFDTWFFVVHAPEGWTPDPNPAEVADCEWSTPGSALERLGQGTIAMAPPTIEMLQRLEGFGTVTEVLDAFATTQGIGNSKILSMRLSPFVQMVLAPNPSLMTGPGTNTYIFGSGPTFVIDPGIDDIDYLDEICALGEEIVTILVTHRHADHVGGIAALVERTGATVRAFGSEPAGGVAVLPLTDGEILTLGAIELEVLHTPGHASDHVCFYVRGAASLFAGDNVLGEGTAVIAPPDGDMADYLRSLHRLRSLHIDRIYTGHFRPLDGGRAIIDGYIEHRMERERKVIGALDGSGASLDEVVERAYADTPVELHPIARYSALAHLEKLKAEGRARLIDNRWAAAPLFK